MGPNVETQRDVEDTYKTTKLIIFFFKKLLFKMA